MPSYRDQGIVLRTYKLGETDRILHLLSPGRGQIRAVAKGVRRPGSRFGGRLEPFSHVDVQCYEGRNLDIVTQAELITSFAAVRADWERSACGSAMVEAADRVVQPDEHSARLFLLLLDGLRALDAAPAGRGTAPPALVLDAYLLRLADVAGYRPDLDACAACAAPGDHRVFTIEGGGVLCERCAPVSAQRLGDVDVRLLRGLLTLPWDALGTAADAVTRGRAMGALVHSYLTFHLVGRPLVAWDLVPR